jgi:hypothetical protein
MASIGPLGMITSNATSKVTNIAAAEHDAGHDALPPRDAPDEAHEAGDQEEACNVKSQPLHENAEQRRRHEHLQHAAQLVARDEGARHDARFTNVVPSPHSDAPARIRQRWNGR